MKNPSHPKRESDVIGHQNSKGRHDITTDNRLRHFKQKTEDEFNKKYGYNFWGSEENLKQGKYQDINKGSYSMETPVDNIGLYGYYDTLHTKTQTPVTNGTIHDLEDKFTLDSFDGEDKPKRGRHQSFVSHKNGRYVGKEKDNRDAVEPKYEKIPYMAARNKGNAEIENYQKGNYEYSKGKGWKLKK